MKKIILTSLILSALMIGCKDNKTKSNNTSESTKLPNHTEETTKESEKQATIYDNAWINEIKLNSGNKWEANLETSQGVENMLKLVASSNPNSIEDYHNLAAELNEQKNYIVKKCTMKGPSHDNLHVFLHPLIEKIAALGKISSIEEGAKITAGIKENLQGYYDYFK